jgi:hypothetical protein
MAQDTPLMEEVRNFMHFIKTVNFINSSSFEGNVEK